MPVHMYMCAYKSMCMSVHIWKAEVNTGYSPAYLSILFFETKFLNELEVFTLGKWRRENQKLESPWATHNSSF